MATNNPTIYPSDLVTIVNTLYAQALADSRIRIVKRTLTSAEILALNGTPISLVAAPGAGYFIRPLAGSVSFNADGDFYATNGQMQLYTNASAPTHKTIAAFLLNAGSDSAANQPFLPQTPGAADTNFNVENAALYVNVATGNPTAGTSTVTVYVSYEIVAL